MTVTELPDEPMKVDEQPQAPPTTTDDTPKEQVETMAL